MNQRKTNKRLSIRKKEQGFTLVEVMIALAIFSIGILGVAAMQTSSVTGNASAMGYTEGSTWAMDQVERLLNLPYTHANLDPASSPFSTTSPDGVYTINWTVTQPGPIPKTKQVVVTVSWQWGFPQRTKSVTIQNTIPQVF
jgi:prepilin-type N-terminal cleavage/methylation domain-containing protein